jgi:septum formation protein
MINQIILASKSEVRKNILKTNKIDCIIKPSNVDEDSVKESLLKEKATPTIISKNLAELKANKISQKFTNEMVLGADSRIEALTILKKLNGKTHQLISSVCISRGGSMIWNYTDKASLTMKQISDDGLEVYLAKISDEALYAYNVYQIEGEGRTLFSKIEGDEDTIMGLPVKKIKEYLNNYK